MILQELANVAMCNYAMYFQVLVSNLKTSLWVPFFMFVCSEAIETLALSPKKCLVSGMAEYLIVSKQQPLQAFVGIMYNTLLRRVLFPAPSRLLRY